ncbi:MAG: hypothetical protein ACOX9C_07750 [Kiritimatiellia bacterium]|jgi:autotransporter-associated beta strand protein
MKRHKTASKPQQLLQMVAVLALSFLAGFCDAAVVTWDGGGTGGQMGYGWRWAYGDEANWDTDAQPGPDDEAVFPDAMVRTAITLAGDFTIRKLTYANQTPLKLGGAGTNTITTTDIEVRNSDNAPSTNSVPWLQLGGNGLWSVGACKELQIGGGIRNDGQGHALTKTGPGLVRCTLYANNSYTGKTVVAEGTLRLEGYNTQLKSPEVVVGDGVHAAMLDIAHENNAHLNMLGAPKHAVVTINTNAVYKIRETPATTTFYPETYAIHGGTLDIGGNAIYLSNDASTPWERSVTMTGGVITNGLLGFTLPSSSGHTGLAIRASARTATIAADLAFGGERYSFHIEDGASPVDLEVTGRIRGNFGFTKTGPGTLALSCPTGGDMRRERKPIIVGGGALLMDGGILPVSGSNSVNVVAGGTLGGTGAICSLDTTFITAHVTLEGEDGNPAVLAPGTVDRATGEWLCGTLRVGTSDVTNNVAFINHGTLRVKLDRGGEASCLAVVGAVSLASSLDSDALDIIAPLAHVPSGEHVLVTFSNLLTGRFDTVTLNGEPLPDSCALEYRNAENAVVTGTDAIAGGSIVLVVPPQESVVIIQ